MTRMVDDRQLLETAISLHAVGNLQKAASIYRQIVDRDSGNSYALHYLGVIEAGAGHLKLATSLVARSVAIQPQNVQFVEDYVTILFQARDYKSAFETCQRGLQINDANFYLLYISAISLFKLKRLQEALARFDNLLLLKPDHLEANNERGSVLAAMGQYDDALKSVEIALRVQPQHAAAHLNKGNVLTKLKRWPEAIAAYDRALELNRNLSDAWLGRGNVLRQFRRYDEAFAAYERALAIDPELAGAWLGRGNVFNELQQYDEAFAAYEKALALDPELAAVWRGRGNILNKLKLHQDASAAFAEALKLDHQYPFLKGVLLHQKMLCCDWRGVENLIAEIESDIFSGRLSGEPFGWQGVARSPRSLQLCAELYNRDTFPAPRTSPAIRAPTSHGKIRIGYCSGEFRNQATSHLLVGVLECHDRSRFEIYTVDNGWDDNSDVRRRITRSVNGLINVTQLSDLSADTIIREKQIDILVNLNGYFGEERTNLFAQRPAPVQVNYLGFPGTLGASYIDYIVADHCVIPEDDKIFYNEKIVYLPNCYQPNDRSKKIATHNFTRQECELPETGFVFCCFNNNYKIVPETFDVWMRILSKVSGSILWLIEDNKSVVENLRKEATSRGVNSDRLIFAKRLPLAEHLARHRLAGLFLDTLPYNAHTTASDALWASLPVLTQIGQTFSGRVAASLLNAVGLPELITSTPQAYEELAVELATNSEKLAAIKCKLADNRLTTPLFDTQLYTRHIEAAYTAMYERYRAGLPPDDIYVP